MGCYKTEKLMYGKGHFHLDRGAAYRVEKIISYTTDRGLLSRIYYYLEYIKI